VVVAGGVVVVVSAVGTVEFVVLACGQKLQASAATTIIARITIHVDQEDRRRGVVLRSGLGLLISLLIVVLL
jgi:hypothetical protein